ncbi:pathogenesis-related protein pr-1, partial [Phtheirospermum japonicum]
PPPPFLPTFNSEQQEYLRAHNEIRQAVGVPPLAWNATLAASAHAWAEERRGDCNYRRHSANPYGENIFWMSYKEFNPTDAVNWWFDESHLYDHARYVCRCYPERDGCECGHYLSVIWSTTRQVGCSGPFIAIIKRAFYVVL